MSHQTSATTTRDVEVTRIPSGERITLATGTEVLITQALGGSFTILVPSQAGLYRIEGQDADAIGQEATSGSETPPTVISNKRLGISSRPATTPKFRSTSSTWAGYSLSVKPHQEGGSEVNVQMTLTAPGCGMGPILASEARQKILTLDGVTDANVDLVWDPPWTPDRISEEGQAS